MTVLPGYRAVVDITSASAELWSVDGVVYYIVDPPRHVSSTIVREEDSERTLYSVHSIYRITRTQPLRRRVVTRDELDRARCKVT